MLMLYVHVTFEVYEHVENNNCQFMTLLRETKLNRFISTSNLEKSPAQQKTA